MELKPGYKQTEVGVIPEEWETRPLLATVRIANGQVDPRGEPYRSMVLVAPDHIESHTGRLLERCTASDQRAISGKYLFDRGDIVYSKIRPYLRKAILATFRGLCSADMYPLTPAKDVSPAFIFAVLLGERFSRFAEAVSVRSGIPKINREELAEYVVALPPRHEQRAIAAALSDVDALIGALDQLIAKKRDLKQAAMQQLLTGQQRLPGFRGEWEMVSLGELFSFKNGLNKAKEFFGEGTPIVNYMDVYRRAGLTGGYLQGRVSVSRQEQKTFDVKKGDVFFTRTSETVEEIGIAAVMLDDPAETVFSGFLLRARPRDESLCDSFKKYCFASRVVRNQITSRSSYTTRALTNGRLLCVVVLRRPPKAEQAAIAAVLSDMDAEIAALEARRDKTRALKQGMMQELLTGRTRLL
jgi:type I restriction enzyme S subunit